MSKARAIKHFVETIDGPVAIPSVIFVREGGGPLRSCDACLARVRSVPRLIRGGGVDRILVHALRCPAAAVERCTHGSPTCIHRRCRSACDRCHLLIAIGAALSGAKGYLQMRAEAEKLKIQVAVVKAWGEVMASAKDLVRCQLSGEGSALTTAEDRHLAASEAYTVAVRALIEFRRGRAS